MTASGNSFPKTERLKRASQFRQILKNAHSVREEGVNLYFLGNSSADKSRLGIVVSRRVFKHASDRNRVKRAVREFFRLRKSKFRASFDFVVRVVDGSKLFENNRLQEILTHLFERAKVFQRGTD